MTLSTLISLIPVAAVLAAGLAASFDHRTQ